MTAADSSRLDRLTLREREIISLIAAGFGRLEIAARLGVSAKTTDAHRLNALRKLDLSVSNQTAGIVLFAVRAGLVDPSGVAL